MLMPNDKAGGYISKLWFNNGQEVEIKANDIVVFVGPNNTGKSQSLKDLYALAEAKVPSVVISDITMHKFSLPISNVLSEISTGSNQGSYISYSVLGHNMTVFSYTDKDFPKKSYLGDYRDLFVNGSSLYFCGYIGCGIVCGRVIL